MTSPEVAREHAFAPPLSLLASEVPRAILERHRLRGEVARLASAPSGDGHPVLVLPGFVASDRSTRQLRQFLRTKGYAAHGWRLGTNLGPTTKILEGLEKRIAALTDSAGRACSIIGWSLGGNFARDIAREQPGRVRQVITLGAPVRLTSLRQLRGGPLYRKVSVLHDSSAGDAIERLNAPSPRNVPTTAIYSRADGFAPWQVCQDGSGPRHESIEVEGGHLGLGHNADVMEIIADRLAQPEGQWNAWARTVAG